MYIILEETFISGIKSIESAVISENPPTKRWFRKPQYSYVLSVKYYKSAPSYSVSPAYSELKIVSRDRKYLQRELKSIVHQIQEQNPDDKLITKALEAAIWPEE